jgi:hypothetical protein
VSGPLVAEFRDAETLRQALGRVKEARHLALDAFTPYPVEGLDEQLAVGPSGIRYAMLVGGLIVAALAFGLQCSSAAIDDPLNVGGRPLNSWQVFLLVPFEDGVFAAAHCGAIAVLWSCGLPRLHNPLFEIPGFERATQDRFCLLASAEQNDAATRDLRDVLESSGAVVVTEVRQP